jgi:hypothetical protein
VKTTRKAVSTVVASIGIIILGLQAVPECGAQPPSPYIPPPFTVTIGPQTNGGSVSVTVSVDLPDTCHYVGSWGQPVLDGNSVYVDAQFWLSYSYCFPVITTVSTNYSFGTLPAGNYTFSFRAWGTLIKTQAFSVPEPGPPRLNILRLTNSQVRISWPTNATNYSLQRAGVLPPQEWITVTNSPAVIAEEFVLTADLAPGQTFYRLRTP